MGWKFRDSSPTQARRFSFPERPDRLWSKRRLLFYLSRSSSRRQRGRRVMLTNHIPLAPSLWINGAITLLRLMFYEGDRDNFTVPQPVKDKSKVHPRTCHEGQEEDYRYISTLSLTSTLDGVVFNATPRPLYPREKPGTHCIGGWVGPRAGLDGCRRYRLPPGFDPRTVQPVASRYTDWAIPVQLRQ